MNKVEVSLVVAEDHEPMPLQEKMQILEAVGSGKLTAKQATDLLKTERVAYWRSTSLVPGDSHRTILRMFFLGDFVEVFAMPSPELQQRQAAQLQGRKFGYRYTIPMSQIRLVEGMVEMTPREDAPGGDFGELLEDAEAAAEEMENPADDSEEEEEEEETEEETVPEAQATPTEIPPPFLPSFPEPTAPVPPNGSSA